jgi:ribosomal protein L37AE/L43A
MKHLETFKDLAARTNSPEEFARRGCEEGVFVSRAEGRRAWNAISQPKRNENTCPACGWRLKGSLAPECAHCASVRRAGAAGLPSALKQAGWGGLAK